MSLAGWLFLVAVLWFVIGTWLINREAQRQYMGSGGIGLWIMTTVLPALGFLGAALVAFLVALTTWVFP